MQHRRHPVHAAQAAVGALALAFAACAPARAEAQWAADVPALEAAGSGRLTFVTFPVYDARLWVAPGFSAAQFERHAFVLELEYLRELSGDAIADRTLAEMARSGRLDAAQRERWRERLRAIFPDVKPGDRIAGANRPGRGVRYYLNGRVLADIDDAQFAQLFFAIWLAPTTSEPGLRAALLKGTAP